jgi:hypothetical protein
MKHFVKFMHYVTTQQDLHLYAFLFLFWIAMVSLLVKLVEFFHKF